MKKKFLIATVLLSTCLGLAACGNPQKLLPEEDESANVYDADEETTGNEALDELIESVADDKGFKGDVTEVYVYKRKDSEDNKEKSKLYVEVKSEKKDISYDTFLEVTMKYDKDDKAWGVKEFSNDSSNKNTFTPADPDEDELKDKIINSAYYVDFGTEYVYLTEAKNVEIKPGKTKMNPGTEFDPAEYEFETEVTIEGDFKKYITSITGTMTMYEQDATWYLFDYEWSEDFESEMSDETLEALSDERMKGDISRDELYLFNSYRTFSESDFDTFEFGEPEFTTSSCRRPCTVHFANNDIFDMSMELAYYYYYSNDTWEFNYFEDSSPDLIVDYSPAVGEYASDIVDNYDGEKVIGKMFLTIDSIDSTGKCSGTLTVAPAEGTKEDGAPTPFEGAETNSYGAEPGSLTLKLDGGIKWSKYNTQTEVKLTYNPETNTLDSVDWQYGYSLEKQ